VDSSAGLHHMLPSVLFLPVADDMLFCNSLTGGGGPSAPVRGFVRVDLTALLRSYSPSLDRIVPNRARPQRQHAVRPAHEPARRLAYAAVGITAPISCHTFPRHRDHRLLANGGVPTNSAAAVRGHKRSSRGGSTAEQYPTPGEAGCAAPEAHRWTWRPPVDHIWWRPPSSGGHRCSPILESIIPDSLAPTRVDRPPELDPCPLLHLLLATAISTLTTSPPSAAAHRSAGATYTNRSPPARSTPKSSGV
jgi:hypothetical protein